MTTYVVAATPDKTKLAQNMILGEFLEKNCPDVSVQMIVKDDSEWEKFVDNLCRSYGFESKPNPIAYNLEGTYIGDGADFIEHIRNRFGKSLKISSDQTRQRTQLNTQENTEPMTKRNQDELPLGEKIGQFLVDMKKQNFVQQIDSGYEEVDEAGIKFYVRRSNFLKDTQSIS